MDKKYSFKVFAIAMIIAITLTACGGAPMDAAPITQVDANGNVIATVLPGTDSGSIAYLVPPIANQTTAESYQKCMQEAVKNDPSIITTDFFDSEPVQNGTVWWCGKPEHDGVELFLIEASVFAGVVPGFGEDVIVLGTTAVYEAGKIVVVVIVLATSYIAGVLAGNYWESHSNREHNPNITGTQARKNIDAFLAMFATSGFGPQDKCGITKDANEEAVRVALWIADSTRKSGGYLVWYFVQIAGTPLKGPWGGSYDITSSDFDLDRTNEHDRKVGLHWSGPIDCNTLTGGAGVPKYLQKAQP